MPFKEVQALPHNLWKTKEGITETVTDVLLAAASASQCYSLPSLSASRQSKQPCAWLCDRPSM